MALNASKIMGKRKELPVLPIATYPAYLVQVIDLGLHQSTYKGEEKAPARKIRLTYEFADEFLPDEDGQPQPDKPRWLSEEMNLFSLKSERATSTARYKTLDPTEVHGGDFVKCLGTPVLVSVGHRKGTGKWEGRIFPEVMGISGVRPKDAAKMDGPVNKPVYLDLDEPDLEVFKSLPEFVQNTIKSNLEYAGSKLSKLLETAGDTAPAKTEQKSVQDELDDEVPY
jgi:hypothetical protein